MTGINALLGGWTSTFPIVTYVQEQRKVYHPGIPRRGRLEDVNSFAYTTTETVTVPRTTTGTTTGQYPNITGVLKAPSSLQRAVSKKVYDYYDRAPVASWGWQETVETIQPNTFLQIDSISGIDTGTFDNAILGGPHISKPVIIVSTDKKIVICAPIQKVETIVTSYRTYSFLWWSWSAPYSTRTWVYQIDMTKATVFHIDNDSTALTSASPALPIQYFANRPVPFQGMYFSFASRSLSDTANIITDNWPSVGIDQATGTAIAKAFLTNLWTSDGTSFIRTPMHRALDSLANILTLVDTAIQELTSVLSSTSSDVITSIVNQFDEQTKAKPDIQKAITIFTDSNRNVLLTYLQKARTSLESLTLAIQNMRATRGVYRKSDVTSFRTEYASVVGVAANSKVLEAMRAYLDVMYEQRLLILKKRINREDGTLMRVAQTEIALAQMEDAVAGTPDPLAALFDARLNVRHKVTNISLMDRATAKTLPTERIRIVYVKVDYDKKGEVIRPPSGMYKLYSRETLEMPGITPPTWYISFKKGSAPKIIKNVVTTIDGTKLQKIMMNPNLTQLEKVCFSRELEDWWEIKIPERKWPENKNYQMDLQLVLAKSDEFIDKYIATTGIVANNPVADSTERIEIGVTWMASPDVKASIDRLNTPLT
jgi:hypothetical protein